MIDNLTMGFGFNSIPRSFFETGMDTSSLFQGINSVDQFCGFNMNPWATVFDMNPYASFNMNLFMQPSAFSFFNTGQKFDSVPLKGSYSSNSAELHKNNDINNPKIPLGIIKPEDAVKKATAEKGQVGGWKYGESGKWCAAFASWAYGGDKAPWGDKHDVAGIKNWAVKNGKYVEGTNTQSMKPGDLIVWRPETCNGKSHVGIVSEVNKDGGFSTIEGNASNKVKNHTYSSSSNFDGFVSLSA